jgi:hypothetical protein
VPRNAWYRHLASANRRIAEARGRIDEQKVFISELERSGSNTQAASALLCRFERALQAMIADRALILSHVRTYGLPESPRRTRRTRATSRLKGHAQGPLHGG